jgi:pimeloyl-ACP methyl ester carboxylesterase
MSQPESEFSSLIDVAAELGLDRADLPTVVRRDVDAEPPMSVLVWGEAEPELVFLHGGGQNAHTWDLVALQLDRPAIAIDLPGHGHSGWRADRDYGPLANAGPVATVIERLAPSAAAVVGMSLGGLTTIRLAAARPELVRRAVIVDVTPGSREATRAMTTEQRGATALIDGQRVFASREEMVEAAVRASPRRPASAVRRGVVHNSRQQPDGTWVWRYDVRDFSGERALAERRGLWDDLSSLRMPCLFVIGGESGFATAGDLDEVRRRVPSVHIESVPGAGHAVQSDRPKPLAELIEAFIGR